MTRRRAIAFVAVANLIGLALVLFAAEFAVRWRAEKGFRGAWHSLFSSAAPFSEFGPSNLLVADPDLGYRFNPAYPGVNSKGLRTPEIAASKKLKRIIVLGDSVAAAQDGFVTLLRERLARKAEVINAAVPGYTTYQERRLLERDLLETKPDLVILQYCLNDNHQFLHRFDERDGMLFTEEARRALAPGRAGWLARHSYLFLRVRLAMLSKETRTGRYPWENQPDVAVAWQDESWRSFEEHLRSMRQQASAIGARLMVVMAPYKPQLDPAVLALGPSYTLKPQAKMADICAAAGVPLLDLYPALAQRGGGDLFRDNYHFNAAGHRVVADTLLEFLRRRGLL